MSKALVAFNPKQLAIIDYIAAKEHRNRSDLIREALRRYEEHYKAANGINFTHVIDRTEPGGYRAVAIPKGGGTAHSANDSWIYPDGAKAPENQTSLGLGNQSGETRPGDA